MPRSRSEALAALAVLVCAGCAFDDGRPWGEVAVELSAAAPASLRTADGASITLDAVELRIERVDLFDGGSTAGSEDFDPAHPPEGCSLCHGGHCHCGDQIISYDELRAEAAGVEETPLLTLATRATAAALGPMPVEIPLAICPERCALPRTTLRRVAVAVPSLHVRGREAAHDVSFDLDLPLAATITAALDVPFGPDEPVGATISLALALPAELFDGIDWTRPAAELDAALSAAIPENYARHAALTVDVTRAD